MSADPHAWARFGRWMSDIIRAPYIAGALALASVAAWSLFNVATDTEPSGQAWLNGVAAVITAVAALAEARHARAAWVDHEVRLQKLEAAP